MAAPTTTTRGIPSGKRLVNGHVATIAFSLNPTLSVWEIDVGVPGIDGGEPIDITVQQNVTWRTRVARTLLTLTPYDVKCAYDPKVFTQLQSLINNDYGSVTTRWWDGSTIAAWAYLQKVTADQQKEGEMPTMTLTICPTNYDRTNGVEAAPLIVEVAGT